MKGLRGKGLVHGLKMGLKTGDMLQGLPDGLRRGN